MHAAREWHDLKWKDERVGQKSSTCKQASLTKIKATFQSVESARACCQRDQRLKKKDKKKKKKKKEKTRKTC